MDANKVCNFRAMYHDGFDKFSSIKTQLLELFPTWTVLSNKTHMIQVCPIICIFPCRQPHSGFVFVLVRKGIQSKQQRAWSKEVGSKPARSPHLLYSRAYLEFFLITNNNTSSTGETAKRYSLIPLYIERPLIISGMTCLNPTQYF